MKNKGLLSFYKRRLSNEKGAMDKIMVTLLLAIVGVGAVVGLTTWMSSSTDTMKTAADSQINNVIQEVDSTSSTTTTTTTTTE